MRTVRIGTGAGFADDRIDPAVELAERGQLDYLVFECLAERTVALAQLDRRRDPARGYDPLLAERMAAVLAPCVRSGTRVITNAGAANPPAAGQVIAELARKAGIPLRIAVVTGDDVLDRIRDPAAVSANAYLGSEAIGNGRVAAVRPHRRPGLGDVPPRRRHQREDLRSRHVNPHPRWRFALRPAPPARIFSGSNTCRSYGQDDYSRH